MTFLKFIILALASYRLQRIVTSDTWYFSDKFREYHRSHATDNRFRRELYELFTCPWCFGWWVTLAVFTVDYFFSIHIYIWAAIAASAIVGYLGSKEDD